MDVQKYWQAVLRQDAEELRTYFTEDAYVNWHCTNERFTLDEFIRANCEYPGQWDGVIERTEQLDNLTVTAVRVFEKDGESSFHVVSFIKTEGDKIGSIDEYWGDDGPAPQWRLEKRIGTPVS